MLPITYPKFPAMCERGDQIFLGRYLVTGADESSVFLNVSVYVGCVWGGGAAGWGAGVRMPRVAHLPPLLPHWQPIQYVRTGMPRTCPNSLSPTHPHTLAPAIGGGGDPH